MYSGLGATYQFDSRDRESGSSHAYSTTLSDPLKGYYALTSVQIPVSYYNVNSNNNSIIFNEGGADLTATITPGVYDTSSLPAAIKTAMDAKSGSSYTVTYSSITSKLTIAITAGTYTIKGDSKLNTSTYIMGFSTSQTAAASLVGNNIVNLRYTATIYIEVNKYALVSPTKYGSVVPTATFAIPITVDSLDTQVYDAKTSIPQYIYVSPMTKNLTVNLYSDSSNALDLNGANWVFSLKPVDKPPVGILGC